MKLKQLKLDKRNANKGTDKGRDALVHSLRSYGAGRSILLDKKGRVIAGNKTVQQAIDAGFNEKDLIIVKTDGSKIVAVQRVDLDLERDSKAKALAIADNRVSELDLEWDPAVLAQITKEADLSALFSESDLKKLIGDDAAKKGGGPARKMDMTMTYSVIVDCSTEGQQEKLLERLEKEGFSCRLLIS